MLTIVIQLSKNVNQNMPRCYSCQFILTDAASRIASVLTFLYRYCVCFFPYIFPYGCLKLVRIYVKSSGLKVSCFRAFCRTIRTIRRSFYRSPEFKSLSLRQIPTFTVKRGKCGYFFVSYILESPHDAFCGTNRNAAPCPSPTLESANQPCCSSVSSRPRVSRMENLA